MLGIGYTRKVITVKLQRHVDNNSEFIHDGDTVVFKHTDGRLLMGTLIDRYSLDGRMRGIVEFWDVTRLYNPGQAYRTVADVSADDIRRFDAWLADKSAWHYVENWVS
jgi:hypothetical protein